MRAKPWIFAVLVVVIFEGVFCFRLWRPARQVELHTDHLLKAASSRNGKAFRSFLDDSYTDRWGHDAASATEDTRLALQQFFALTITAEPARTEIKSDRGIVTARLKIAGNGTAIAQEIRRRINDLRAPFIFEWRHKSAKPWDWQLVRVDNAELDWDRSAGF